MKSPLWIVTSALAIVLLVLLTFIVYSMRTLFVPPEITSIKVTSLPEVDKKSEAQPADLSLIYEEHDLFGTYHPSIVSIKPVETLPVIPPPPQRIPLDRRPKMPIQFLKPLPIKITGIIASSSEAKSQVSLLNNNTGKTESYKMGDKVFDAYILRIFPTKIIIIRSNGQQETLYLYSDEAKADTAKMQDTSWTDVIEKHGEHNYLLNPTTFGSRINSLAGLIDLLDLTTASKGGQPLGVRIGKMEPTSLGYACGFQPGDIITKILDIAPTSSSFRMKIFNKIIASDLGAHIPVEFLRDGTSYTTTFTLFNLANPSATIDGSPLQPLTKESKPRPIESEKVFPETPHEVAPAVKLTQEPIVEKIKPVESITTPLSSTQGRNRDLDAMKKYGGKSASMEQPSSEKPTQQQEARK